MRSLVLAVIIVICSVSVEAVTFRDCGSKGKDLKLTISGCSDADAACPFVTGQNVTLTAEFTTGKLLKNIFPRNTDSDTILIT